MPACGPRTGDGDKSGFGGRIETKTLVFACCNQLIRDWSDTNHSPEPGSESQAYQEVAKQIFETHRCVFVVSYRSLALSERSVGWEDKRSRDECADFTLWAAAHIRQNMARR